MAKREINKIKDELIEEYGLFQGKSENLGDAKDVPVIFTPKETLTLERMAEIIRNYLEEQKEDLLKKMPKEKEEKELPHDYEINLNGGSVCKRCGKFESIPDYPPICIKKSEYNQALSEIKEIIKNL